MNEQAAQIAESWEPMIDWDTARTFAGKQDDTKSIEGVAPMELRITLAPDGGIRLILPTRRTLDLGPNVAALRFIQRILRDAKTKRDQPGYIAEFPTQHVIDIWKRQDAEHRLEIEKDKFKNMGIDVEKLEISL